ncbi:hypothetical protein EYZ11_006689 [Aspergillus tanneri]|uniref:Uncharacterized protein n=1 Tax=Aspergillus tanneri TaxID=1220188 RepID=A0A4S3JH47_9EURO|nr:hypothetical protein EYZ11_006689 [Aspergillus tanneri]
MNRLPSPILSSICGLLWEDCPRIVHVLALVNSSCYHAAVPFIYSSLSLRLTTGKQLERTVEEIFHHPLRRQCLSYARQLNLGGQIFRLPNSPEDEENISRLEIEYWDGLATQETDICSAAELEPTYKDIFTNDGDEQESYESATSAFWAPLATLITHLQHLVVLNYSCVNQFPPCLLEALHMHHPACKLNLDTFRFHSLQRPETDPFERDLIRSPCLHGLTVRYVRSLSEDDIQEDYNEEAVIETVQLAPHLKQLRFQQCSHLITEESEARRSDPKAKRWNGFVPPIPAGGVREKATLTCLTTSGTKVGMDSQTLDEWDRRTDLSTLQSLNLNYVSRTDVLSKATELGCFRSLKKLAIHLAIPCSTAQDRLPAEMFFNSLPPLKTLRLFGLINMPLLQTILKRHGPSLRELRIHPRAVMHTFFNVVKSMVLTATEISWIGESCPHVEQLDLIMNRSKGDRRETACYEALGKFPALKEVYIHLFYSMEPLRSVENLDGPLDEYDRLSYNDACGNKSAINAPVLGAPLRPHEWCTAHIRDALINAAIDTKLARAIWETIVSCPSHREILQRLILHPHVFCADVSYSIEEKVTHMARRLQVDWKGYGNEVDITEIGREIRERRDKEQRRLEREMLEKWGTLQGARLADRTIMSRIWPEQSDTQDWRDAWSSLPLAD